MVSAIAVTEWLEGWIGFDENENSRAHPATF
jgi:hypothetical protein